MTADDIIDAHIHEEHCDRDGGCRACLDELRERVARVLAEHEPCHTAETEPWGCKWGHGDDACETGIPASPALCTVCTYDDREVRYPCPTAATLGVDWEASP